MKRFLTVLLLLMAGCSTSTSPVVTPGSVASAAPGGRTPILTAPPGGAVVWAGEHALAVEVAATPDARRDGLMGVDDLGPDQGMLFILPEPNSFGFWMKGTEIDLSIAFLSGDLDSRSLAVTTVHEMVVCTSEQEATEHRCPIYKPKTEYIAAVEANAGWFTDHGIEVGDVLRIKGELPSAT